LLTLPFVASMANNAIWLTRPLLAAVQYSGTERRLLFSPNA
jgi:hypothetical protein